MKPMAKHHQKTARRNNTVHHGSAPSGGNKTGSQHQVKDHRRKPLGKVATLNPSRERLDLQQSEWTLDKGLEPERKLFKQREVPRDALSRQGVQPNRAGHTNLTQAIDQTCMVEQERQRSRSLKVAKRLCRVIK